MFKLTGIVKLVKPEEVISDKFKKREFILTDASSMYPQDISFQLAQDKCSLADGFVAGEQIEVHFNLRGREWISPTNEAKYFNTLEAWKIEKIGSAQVPSAPSVDSSVPTSPDAEDNLPF